MKTLLTVCLFVVAFLLGSSALAAESWVYGTGVNKVAAKELALEVASANLPAGVVFHVVRENFEVTSAVTSPSASTSSASTTSPGWVCNLLVRYGTGVTVLAGTTVYHAHKAKASTKSTKSKTSRTKANGGMRPMGWHPK